jgi:tRNA pseudouridine55 synthase
MSEARERRPGPPRGKHRPHKKPKGIALDGWLIIDKPTGEGSTDVVTLCKRGFNAQKCGHGGTLDPLATGVLPIAFGAATKTVPYVMDGTKTYRFTLKFGEARDSDDADGKVIATSDARPDDATIRAALPHFIGDIMQVPPIFSAIKVAGERAYDLAREGEVVDIAARPLWVESLRLLARPDADHAELEMVCGKGGYVRAIARDLGAALGCLGHVAWLRRTWSGPFDAADGVSMDQIEALAGTPKIDTLLRPLEEGLADLPELPATPEGAARLRNGNPGMVITSSVEYGDEAWASYQGRAVAVGVYKAGELHPSRVFAEPKP